LSTINREDLMEFKVYLRDVEELASRSVYNRFENVMTFLKVYGITSATLHFRKGDWPIFMETEPEIYEREAWTNSSPPVMKKND
jgi:hypothetical protein